MDEQNHIFVLIFIKLHAMTAWYQKLKLQWWKFLLKRSQSVAGIHKKISSEIFDDETQPRKNSENVISDLRTIFGLFPVFYRILRRTQKLAYLLLDPADSGSIPCIPKKFQMKKLSSLLRSINCAAWRKVDCGLKMLV